MSNPISKNAIDKLGDALRDERITREHLVTLDSWRRSHLDPYRETVHVAVHQLGLSATGRPSKSTTSIVEKLKREKIRLSQMQDIAGCRVVVEGIPEQNLAVNALEVYLDASVVDRREKPSHGYRAVHLISRRWGLPVEIQVRTRLQHLWAEISEKLSDEVDPGVKYGRGDSRALQILSNLSGAIGSSESEEAARHEALQTIERSAYRPPKPLRRQIKLLESSYSKRRSRLLELLNELKELNYG